MNKIELINASCAEQNVDAVVNAANSGLWAGGGICGVIFSKAGMKELTNACSKYETPLKDGAAVITPAFNMKNAKAVIHAVGPDFGRTPTAFKELFDAYYNSLTVLMDNGYHSISFPLISSGIFGGALSNPAGESAKQCLRAYKRFIADYPDYGVDVKLCAFSASEMAKAQEEFKGLLVDEGNSDYSRQKEFCRKYEMLLKAIYEDEELRKWCNDYSVYVPVTEHVGLKNILNDFMDEAYDVNLVVHNYGEIVSESKLDERLVADPNNRFIEQLNEQQVVACIAWHFRRDHFSEGSLISDSIGNGILLRYFESLISR